MVAASVNQAKGNFDGKLQDYTIGANDQLLTSADYRPLVVAYRNGAPVVLSDVANVIDSAENIRQAAWMNQSPAVILNIQRQPGANIIAVVDRVTKLLPQLRASLPAAVDVIVLTDRTTTIRASVRDVEFELMLTIGLVVMVIFLFLRTLAATVIPSVAVPLSLVGTFGVMYLLGFSLNNLTLMALTISTGFVVDDAIVMIENIARYIEAGEPALQAAFKGAEQIGFTILSLTVSLIAVLIPLLFMGDVVGRLFREFAITLERHHSDLRGGLAHPDADDVLAASCITSRSPSKAGSIASPSTFSNRSSRSMDARSGWVLEHQVATLMVAARDAGVDRLLVLRHPQRLLPGAGHGRDSGDFRSAANRILHLHGGTAAGIGQGDPQRSGGGKSVVLHRHRRHQHHRQQRTDSDQSEADRRPKRSAPTISSAVCSLSSRLWKASRYTCSRCRI